MDKIEELLTRGVDKIYPSKKDLEKVLRSGKKLRIYQGFDPTGTQLHIGHAVAFRKHRQWQDLGHEVIFLIGDGTGQAGDPSGKTTARDKFLTREELRANAKDYIKQAGKIVRFDGPNPVRVLYNGDWLNKLGLVEILDIAQHFSVQELWERDIYQERLKKGETVNLREFLYPLLQAYDSVAMEVDLELGGSDQTFNMLMGRKLVREMQGREKFVMTTPLLTDSQGRKIGKTEGNVIGITDKPSELFAKIMSLGDEAIINCFTLVTTLPLDEIEKKQKRLESGENPLTLKKELALQIVTDLNSKEAGKKAQEEFEEAFQKGKPDFGQTVPARQRLAETIAQVREVGSKSNAKRLIKDGGVDINGKTVTDPEHGVKSGDEIKVGKKIFLKVK